MNRGQVIAFFESAGRTPSRRLGQHYLVDRNLARVLVDHAALQAGDKVLEVGPGLGMITGEILRHDVRLYAVEQDAAMVAYLRDAYGEKLDLMEADAVRFPLAGSSDASTLKVIANPPFSITGPWISGVLDHGLPLCLALLLQKEATERLTAPVGTKLCGPLSIRLGAAYDAAWRHRVPPQCFYPPPQVESEIVVFKRLKKAHRFSPDFIGLMRGLFEQRRKQLGGMLRKKLSASQLQEWDRLFALHGLNLSCRPEVVPVSLWMELDKLHSETCERGA